MIESKLYQILSKLDKVRRNRLRKFVLSPYFNANKSLVALFDLFNAHINHDKKSVEMTKEYCWKAIFPNEAFKDTQFRKLNSDLVKLVETFLSQEVYERNTLLQTTHLLEAIHQDKLETIFGNLEKSVRELSVREPFRGSDFYYLQYQLELKYFILSNAETKRETPSNAPDIIKNLDNFYLAEKLRWYCAVSIRKKYVEEEDSQIYIDDIIQFIQRGNYSEVPPVAIFYQAYLMYATQKEEDYRKLRALVNQYADLFPAKIIEEIYSHIINYCVEQSNQGNSAYLKEMYSVYKEMLGRRVFGEDESEFSPWHYKNIVTIGLRLGEIDWAEQFVHTYGRRLPEAFRETGITYNLAVINFYRGNYDEVLRLFQKVEFQDVAYSLGSRNMMMCIYYEQDDYDALYYLIKNFKIYLNRHKEVGETRKMQCLNQMKYLKKMMSLNIKDKEAIKTLREEIEATQLFANKNWLLKKMDEFK